MNNQNNIWYFGNGAGLDFNPPTIPSVISSPSINTFEGCSTICDETTGAIIFYTDGRTVWNAAHAVIPNGTGLAGNPSSTSSSIIVPMPGNNLMYYIFTVDSGGGNNGLQYSIVDATNPLAPFVTTTKNVQLITPTSERLIAVKHSNCVDYWIITTSRTTNDFHVYLLNSTGVGPRVDQPVGAANFPAIGYLKASPTADRLALTKLQGNDVEYFDFDVSTGTISNSQLIAGVQRGYGLEFSPDGNLLYFSDIAASNGTGTGFVYQKELNNTNPFVIVGTIPNNGSRYAGGALQIAPDGVIYNANDGTNFLSTISTPNAIDTGLNECGFTLDVIPLNAGNTCYLGLPTLVQFQHCEDSENCKDVQDKVNDILSNKCEAKVNSLHHCEQDDECDCDPNTDCVSLEIPQVKPCISIKWGDSECDCLESDDYEVMCLTVCNCFSNVVFKDFTIGCLEVCHEDGTPIEILPDGTPSVQLIPIGPYCFGDIEPCSCKSREFTLIIRGARSGKYKIKVSGICYDVCFHFDDEGCFEFDICKD